MKSIEQQALAVIGKTILINHNYVKLDLAKAAHHKSRSQGGHSQVADKRKHQQPRSQQKEGEKVSPLYFKFCRSLITTQLIFVSSLHAKHVTCSYQPHPFLYVRTCAKCKCECMNFHKGRHCFHGK